MPRLAAHVFGLLLASGGVGLSAGAVTCSIQADCIPNCDDLSEYCETTFCPTCEKPGYCDTTCGFETCTPIVTTTETTTSRPATTVRVLDCPSVNTQADFWCEEANKYCATCNSWDLCGVLFCPDCPRAHECDQTCNFCSVTTTTTTSSATSTSTTTTSSMTGSSTTTTRTITTTSTITSTTGTSTTTSRTATTTTKTMTTTSSTTTTKTRGILAITPDEGDAASINWLWLLLLLPLLLCCCIPFLFCKKKPEEEAWIVEEPEQEVQREREVEIIEREVEVAAAASATAIAQAQKIIVRDDISEATVYGTACDLFTRPDLSKADIASVDDDCLFGCTTEPIHKRFIETAYLDGPWSVNGSPEIIATVSGALVVIDGPRGRQSLKLVAMNGGRLALEVNGTLVQGQLAGGRLIWANGQVWRRTGMVGAITSNTTTNGGLIVPANVIGQPGRGGGVGGGAFAGAAVSGGSYNGSYNNQGGMLGGGGSPQGGRGGMMNQGGGGMLGGGGSPQGGRGGMMNQGGGMMQGGGGSPHGGRGNNLMYPGGGGGGSPQGGRYQGGAASQGGGYGYGNGGAGAGAGAWSSANASAGAGGYNNGYGLDGSGINLQECVPGETRMQGPRTLHMGGR